MMPRKNKRPFAAREKSRRTDTSAGFCSPRSDHFTESSHTSLKVVRGSMDRMHSRMKLS